MTKTILEEAEQIINGDRRSAYGSVEKSFRQSAKIWSGILDTNISPQQVALCMIGLKLQRESYSHKRDNLVDIIGYTLLNEKLNDKSSK
ncbi:MAG: DUF6378 domain-containing protein [bacterium]